MSNLATIVNNILADSGIDDINVVVSTGSYADPAWITSLAWTKITGAPSGIVTGTGTTNYLPKFTGTSTIGNSQIFDNGTNVGIGTASPNARLELTSNSPSSAEVQRWSYNNGNADFSLRLKQEVTSGLVTHVFDLVNNGTTYSNNLVLTNGNIGISVIPSSWASNYKAIQISSFAALTQGGNDTYLGNNWFNDGSNKYLQTSGASIYGQSNGSHFWLTAPSGTAGNAISFTQAMTLTAAGNLGLGVTPSAWSSGGRIEIGNDKTIVAQGPNILLGTNLYFNSGFKYVTTGASTYYYQTDGTHKWYQAPSGTAGNAISFTQAMTLTSGNLLVGTTTDNGARLQVSGSITSTTSVQTIFSLSSTDTNGRTWTFNTAGTTSYGSGAGSLVLRNNGVDALVFNASSAATFSSSVTAAGGTEIPNGQFYRARRSSGSLLTDMIGIPSGTDDVRLLTTGDYNIVNGSLTNLMTIKNGGNVGIGTASPTSFSGYTTLDIYNGSDGGFLFVRSPSVTGDFHAHEFTGNVFLGTRTNSSLVFRTNVAERMRITSTGNVLIGTSTDNGARLQVSGSVNITGEGTHIGIDATGGVGRLGFVKQSGAQPFMAFAADPFTLRVSSGATIAATNTFSPVLTVATTGAATFSSSVTAASLISASATFSNFGSATAAVVAFADGNTGFFRPALNTLGITTAGSERMRITSTGNVLIGTTSDNGARLQVSGAAVVTGNLTTNGIFIGRTSNGQALGVGNGVDTDLGIFVQTNNILFSNSGASSGFSFAIGGSTRFLIASTGAATFSSSVTATGNAATTPAFIANNPSGAGGTAQHYIDFTAGATVISRMSRGNGASGLVGNGLNIDNFDGFGIRLNQLGGSGGTFNVTGGASLFSNSVQATQFIPNGTSAPTIGMYQPSANVLGFSTNTTERLRIFSGGNVHIGPTPGSDGGDTLQVSGTTRLSGRVGVNTAPISGTQLLVQGENNSSVDFGLVVRNSSSANLFSVRNDGLVSTGTSGSILTGAPYGTTASAWKLGRFLTETTSANGSIRVQIGTKYYNIAAQDLGEVPS